jgi:rhamnosyltransferase
MQPRSMLVAIPSYRPSEQLIHLVGALIEEGLAVVVVDDGSGLASASVLRRVEDLGARVIRHPQNRGIAAALNTALEEAATQEVEWLYTLDQDSFPEIDFPSKAMAFLLDDRLSDLRVGILSPAANNGVRIAGRKREDVHHPYDPIQSGSLLAVAIGRRVGGFKTEFFIDGVDSEMTARLRQAGYSVVSVPETDMQHALGHRVPATIAGRRVRRHGIPLTVNQHAPFRVYYMTRNAISITRTYFLSSPLWVARRLGIEIVAHAMRIILGENRRSQVRAVNWGVRDGVQGRMGALDRDRLEKLGPRK